MTPTFFLIDNGSLGPAATLSLREIAARLGAALGRPVEPVSLLHSHQVPAAQLQGVPAQILEAALTRRLADGEREFVVVPLFFGPSGALTDYLPQHLAQLRRQFPDMRVRTAACLADAADGGDRRLAGILEDHVRAKLVDPTEPPAVILVDHGSPVRAVTAVRDQLAAQLRERLGPAVRGVLAASMERRPEPAYDFNEPLLARAFDQPGFDAGAVLVAPLFLAPGRHAGPGGDIARICAEAQQRHPRLRIVTTALVGTHPALISILADRARTALATLATKPFGT